jgi:hypothetical protein
MYTRGQLMCIIEKTSFIRLLSTEQHWDRVQNNANLKKNTNFLASKIYSCIA